MDHPSEAPPAEAETATEKGTEQVLKGSDLIREHGLLKILAEDYRTHNANGQGKLRPGTWAIFAYRWGTWAQTLRPRPVKWAMLFFYFLGQRFVRNFYGIELQRTAQIGRRLELAHQSGIVIHKLAHIGDDVTIHQNVTFGAGTEWTNDAWPVIGNRVSFSPGVVVIGNVNIGDDVSIGPNCVISQDVPANRVLFVPPPRSFPKATEVDAQKAGTQSA